MLDQSTAQKRLKKALPNGKVQAVVTYKDLYLFQVFDDDPDEGEYDPFYSVNRQTGEVREFSILTDGDISEITTLFLEAKSRRG